MPALQRPGFKKLLERLAPGDTLVVTKLDRIGRDSIDVQRTVELCAANEIRLIDLETLGGLADLRSVDLPFTALVAILCLAPQFKVEGPAAYKSATAASTLHHQSTGR